MFVSAKATRGKRSRGWPSNAREKLKEYGLILKISADAADYPIEELLLDHATKTLNKKEVEYILEALHKKWIKLKREETQDEDAAQDTDDNGQ